MCSANQSLNIASLRSIVLAGCTGPLEQCQGCNFISDLDLSVLAVCENVYYVLLSATLVLYMGYVSLVHSTTAVGLYYKRHTAYLYSVASIIAEYVDRLYY